MGRALPKLGAMRLQAARSSCLGLLRPHNHRPSPSPHLAGKVTWRSYADSSRKLDLLSLDQKWRERWSSLPPVDASREHKYVLPMFPYPSGSLHLGHLRVYAIADVVARFYSLQGHKVILPMGWDAFGLPAENAAIERGINPASWTKQNIAKMKEQLEVMNGSWDWSRVRIHPRNVLGQAWGANRMRRSLLLVMQDFTSTHRKYFSPFTKRGWRTRLRPR